METNTAPPRRNDALLLGGMRAARSTSMRFTEPQGHTEEQPAPPRRSTRSTAPPPYTPIYSSYGFIILSLEEEERLSRLEKRLVPYSALVKHEIPLFLRIILNPLAEGLHSTPSSAPNLWVI
jgi:hypothetical protein